ncbi:hypothetical protein BpHYR1_022879, partial [Brachionus plicatilis]
MKIEMTKLTAGQEGQMATMIAEAFKKVKLEENPKMDEVLEKLKTLGEENDALRVEFDQLKEKMTKLDGSAETTSVVIVQDSDNFWKEV